MSDEQLDQDADDPTTELVKVFETSEPDVLPVIKSILDAARLPYTLDGEGMMNTFPSEALSSGATQADASEVRIYVAIQHAEEAAALLSENFQLAENPPELAEGE